MSVVSPEIILDTSKDSVVASDVAWILHQAVNRCNTKWIQALEDSNGLQVPEAPLHQLHPSLPLHDCLHTGASQQTVCKNRKWYSHQLAYLKGVAHPGLVFKKGITAVVFISSPSVTVLTNIKFIRISIFE